MIDGTCDGCGAAEVVPDRRDPEGHDTGSRYCSTCWLKRDQWDEGARSTALMAVGNAVALARHWDVAEPVILAAVNLALSEPEGLHPDDALSLGSNRTADPRRGNAKAD